MNSEQITLFFKQDKSDKIYNASLEEKEGLFIVNFSYGRRASTLKTGTKTKSPIAYKKAKKIYDKLVLSKTVKGYIPNENSTDYCNASNHINTGIHCQLLNPVDADLLIQLLTSDQWVSQEKMDGKRMLLQKTSKIIAINRKGFSVAAPEAVINAAKAINKEFIIDGELIGATFYVFDILCFNGDDFKKKTYQKRFELLETINFTEAIKIVPLAKNTAEKQLLFENLKSKGSEGIVFKKHSSLYNSGRPNSGGDQLKFKFYETASVVVSKINDKRSVGMSILKNTEFVFIGNVSIASNKEIPKLHSIIEVRYLYAYKEGSLYQPIFLNVRNDIDKNECIVAQLKYKKGL